jgi:RimJ/RimL family protein N-acetyltransferase
VRESSPIISRSSATDEATAEGDRTMKQPTLTTARLTIEPLRKERVDGLVAMFADPRASRYFPVDFSDEDRAREMLASRLAYSGPPELGYWTWLLDGQVAGLGHLQPARDLPSELIEVGWCVKPARWRQGLAAEAVLALLDYALRVLGVPAVWALIGAQNTPSTALAERLGFLRVGNVRADGGPTHVYVRLPGRLELRQSRPAGAHSQQGPG